jgi:hypothetical protein
MPTVRGAGFAGNPASLHTKPIVHEHQCAQTTVSIGFSFAFDIGTTRAFDV